MRLNEWQREVERYLLGNQSTPDAALAASLLGSAALSAEQGLAIYHNAYRARLLEALQGDYAAIHAWLGDDDFERLGRDYLDAHPRRTSACAGWAPTWPASSSSTWSPSRLHRWPNWRAWNGPSPWPSTPTMQNCCVPNTWRTWRHRTGRCCAWRCNRACNG